MKEKTGATQAQNSNTNSSTGGNTTTTITADKSYFRQRAFHPRDDVRTTGYGDPKFTHPVYAKT